MSLFSHKCHVVIVDYGSGNLKSVQKAFEKCKAKATISSDPEVILKAEKLVLPGVGAFGNCMEALNSMNLTEAIKQAVNQGKPFLGICMGLQVLFEEGLEFGKHQGLGLLKGKVVPFKLPKKLKVPHMGWNKLQKKIHTPIFDSFAENAYFYFVHSYHVQPADKKIIATTTKYGIEFVSAIQKDNITAVQFHPEKSQSNGLKLIEAFIKDKN